MKQHKELKPNVNPSLSWEQAEWLHRILMSNLWRPDTENADMARTISANLDEAIQQAREDAEFAAVLDEDEDEERCWEDDDPEIYGESEDWIMFADPGGRSALRAATPDNPRNLPCPNCGEPNRLTPEDRKLGYQCNTCADKAEGYINF